MKSIKKFLVMFMVGLGLCVAVIGFTGQEMVFANSICDDKSIDADLKEAAGCKTDATITTTATGIIDVVLAVVGILTVAVMVYGGFMYVTSQGDSAKVRRGQQILIYGAVGLLVCLLAFAIVRFVGSAFVNEN